jgi:hypothetical protein
MYICNFQSKKMPIGRKFVQSGHPDDQSVVLPVSNYFSTAANLTMEIFLQSIAAFTTTLAL